MRTVSKETKNKINTLIRNNILTYEYELTSDMTGGFNYLIYFITFKYEHKTISYRSKSIKNNDMLTFELYDQLTKQYIHIDNQKYRELLDFLNDITTTLCEHRNFKLEMDLSNTYKLLDVDNIAIFNNEN